MSKCVMCDVGSIFEVSFVTQNFFHYMFLGTDLEIFAVYFVHKHYDHLCLNYNNSNI